MIFPFLIPLSVAPYNLSICPSPSFNPTDPMSSSNPYASASSPANASGGKSRKKWWWIGGILLLLIVIGAVLGGVLGTQLNKNRSTSTSSAGNSNNAAGQPGGNQVPSGASSINTAQLTATAANRVLAIATDSYRLPIYATGVSTVLDFHRVGLMCRPTPLATLRLPLLLPLPATHGPRTPIPQATRRSALTLD
jgi:hypothetical protein